MLTKQGAEELYAAAHRFYQLAKVKLQALLVKLKLLDEKLRPVITGFVKALPDPRDHVYTGSSATSHAADTFGDSYGTAPTSLGVASLPKSVDLTAKFGPVDDQLTANTCVAQAVTAAFEAQLRTTDRSRLFAYFNARLLANQASSDSGATVRNTLKALAAQGLPAEAAWPYSLPQLTTKPSTAIYAEAAPLAKRVKSYATIQSFDSFKTALANGLPVIFGFTAPASFRTSTSSTGVQQLPKTGEALLGGHCVVAVGYDDATQLVKVRNSFGKSWGKGGYFYMPYGWFANLGKSMGDLIIDPWVMLPA